MCPILTPAQSTKAWRRMREMAGGRWSEKGRTGCGRRLGLKNRAGPVRCEQITSVQDGNARASSSLHLKT